MKRKRPSALLPQGIHFDSLPEKIAGCRIEKLVSPAIFVVNHADRSIGNGLICGVFFAMLVFMCVLATREFFIRDAKILIVLIMFPFVVALLVFAWMTLRNFFHRETLRIGNDGIEYRYTALFSLFSRFVPLDQLVEIRPGKSIWTISASRNNHHNYWAFEIETTTETFLLLNGLVSPEKDLLLATINRFIADKRESNSIPALKTETFHRFGAIEFQENGEQLKITGNSDASWGIRLFSLFFLGFWSIGLVYLPVGLIASLYSFSLFIFVFCFVMTTVFWTIGIAVFYGLLRMCFLQETVTIDADGLTYCAKVLRSHHEKRVPLADIRGVIATHVTSDQTALELRTTGKSILCFQRQHYGYDFEFFSRQINAHVKKLKKQMINDAIMESPLTPENVPRDFRWKITKTGGSHLLSRSGSVRFRDIGATVFQNIFWNGTITIFALLALNQSPIQIPLPFQIFLSLLLIPFLLLGFGLVKYLFMLILEPFTRYSIRFDASEIQYKICCFGSKRTRTWARTDSDRILVTRERERKAFGKFQLPISLDQENADDYVLRFSTKQSDAILSIPSLRKGEADTLRKLIKDSYV